MINIDDLVKKLKESNIREVARKTGLHFNTVYLIANGKNKNPTYSVLLKISEHLNAR